MVPGSLVDFFSLPVVKSQMMKTKDKNVRSDRAVRERPPVEYGSSAAMKRLTIDVSADLHSAIKVDCARRRIKMADAIRAILENEFGTD